jgi:TetR/AcrR family transcriptional regulator, regulator of cefoperazone and chloramphenicol sensitivity
MDERMSETVPAAPKKTQTAKLRAVASAGYRKGEETRQRILDAALNAYGADSFKAVTTRRIAQAAGVSLPTLQYYFGDKEGLYRACAETIVERYRQTTGAAAQAARALSEQVLSEDRAAETTRAQLKALIRALAGFLIGSTEADRWAQFVARELRDPGPAFEILYESLWCPGIELVARLIARILGRSQSDPTARIQALLLVTSLLAFQSRRSISLRTMHWSSIGPEELAMVLSSLDTQIDAIGGNPAVADGRS